MQHRDLDPEIAHEVHIVLYDQHRARARDVFEQRGGCGGFGIAHPGRRLIDKQQLGILRQQHADLQPLFLAVRQGAGAGLTLRRQLDQVHNLIDALGVLRALSPKQTGPHPAPPLYGQADVVGDAVTVEHRGCLELAPDAQCRDSGLVARRQVDGLIEQHIACVRPGLAGDDVHHGGFAGSVGADDGAHLSRFDNQ